MSTDKNHGMDGTKQIKGVSTELKSRKPMPLGKSEVAGSRSETIHSHIHRTGGHQVDGVDPRNVHSTARSTQLRVQGIGGTQGT